jgi:DNA-binding transcriptional regulator YdaS (Cro superfamily)
MDLSTYFTAHDGRVTKNGAKLAEVARQAKVSSYYLYMVVSGHKPVSPQLATALQIATNGACTRRETCPEFPWDEPKAA